MNEESTTHRHDRRFKADTATARSTETQTTFHLELTHVTARAAAHCLMPPPPFPPPFRVMVARPAQVTQVTQVPITLLHEPLQHDTATALCDTTHPMWRHCGTAQPKPPPPPPLRDWVSSLACAP